MTKHMPPSPATPFIAWSYAQSFNAFSSVFHQSCEKHLQATQSRMAEILGPPAIDGIILCDHMERGMAVAELLTRSGKTLPPTCDGATCDSHFDEQDLCDQTNAHDFLARFHSGARGMLMRKGEHEERRFILLRQSEAAHLHPMGFRKNPDLALAATGLLAHELGHARDYSDGRPGLPSLDEVKDHIPPERAEAIHTIADMALAEYVATRAECTVQTRLHGGCSRNLADRIPQMARQQLKLPGLEVVDPEGSDAHSQHRVDLSTAGYFLGTLAAYHQADAPIMDQDATPSRRSTADQVRTNLPARSALASLLEQTTPALEQAAAAPGPEARRHLATTLDAAFTAARDAGRDREVPRRRDPSLGDWFDEL